MKSFKRVVIDTGEKVSAFFATDIQNHYYKYLFLENAKKNIGSKIYESDSAFQSNSINYWKKQTGLKINTVWHDYYSSVNGIKDVRYVPENIYYAYIEPFYNRKDFCQCCGLDDDNGNNYRRLKREIRKLSNKSEWVEVWGDPDTEVLVRLVSKAWFNARSGKVRIRLDEDIKPYILELRKNWEQKGELYTQFALLYTLPMKSLYSIRLYELLKSWANA